MRVTTDEVTYIHSAGRLVAKLQIHSTVTRIFCFYNIQSAHSYILRCKDTTNFAHTQTFGLFF